jgi:hypothetical protein
MGPSILTNVPYKGKVGAREGKSNKGTLYKLLISLKIFSKNKAY